MFEYQLETVLKIFRYTIQPPVLKETMEELTEIYGNFSFLQYKNVTDILSLKTSFMTSNPDAKVFLCKYVGKIGKAIFQFKILPLDGTKST